MKKILIDTNSINGKRSALVDGEKLIDFDVDNYKKMCLINGYDDIDYLISKKDLIKNFINN